MRLAQPDREATGPADVSSHDLLSEVHCIVSARYIVTVHRGNSPAIEDAARRAGAAGLATGPSTAFYHVADSRS